jgi:hypothetical protein
MTTIATMLGRHALEAQGTLQEFVPGLSATQAEDLLEVLEARGHIVREPNRRHLGAVFYVLRPVPPGEWAAALEAGVSSTSTSMSRVGPDA